MRLSLPANFTVANIFEQVREPVRITTVGSSSLTWKYVTVANTLAYKRVAWITTVESLTEQAFG
jgi:hypothetical protein